MMIMTKEGWKEICMLSPTPAVPEVCLRLEQEWVAQRNASITISNDLILATRELRPLYERFNCASPDRELHPLLEMPK